MKALRNTVELLIVLSLTVVSQVDWVKAAAAGESGKALKCDASGDFMKILHSQSLNIIGPLTIEVWLKSTSEDFHQATVLAKGITDNEWAGYSVSISDKGHVLFFSGNDRTRYVESHLPLSPHQWYHITGVVRGNKKNKAEIWINGFLDTKGTLGYAPNTSEVLYVGQRPEDRPFRGEIDEVRVYNRALRAEEIESDMGLKISGSEKSLVVYYDFDELTPEGKVKDRSSFENHGTLQGDALLVESTAPVFPSYDAMGAATEDLISQTEGKLNQLKRDAIEISSIEKHMHVARNAFQDKEFQTAFQYAYNAHVQLHEIWDILQHYATIRNDVKFEMKDFKKKGIDTSHFDTKIKEAEEALREEHFEHARKLIADVKLNADEAWDSYPHIEGLKKKIEEVEKLGCDTGKAKKKMKEAMNAFHTGGYSRIAEIVQDGLGLAHQANCGMVKIMDLIAQAAKYDGKTVEIKGQIKDLETVYDRGHKIAVDDGTGLMWIEYKGSMKYLDYWQKLDYLDKVYIKGTFSEKNALILATKVR